MVCFSFGGKKKKLHPCKYECNHSISFSRAESGTRTRDLLITNELLYQLSYFGKRLTS